MEYSNMLRGQGHPSCVSIFVVCDVNDTLVQQHLNHALDLGDSSKRHVGLWKGHIGETDIQGVSEKGPAVMNRIDVIGKLLKEEDKTTHRSISVLWRLSSDSITRTPGRRFTPTSATTYVWIDDDANATNANDGDKPAGPTYAGYEQGC
jgi:hypothetical protein